MIPIWRMCLGLACLLGVLLTGCAASGGADRAYLLEQDYLHLSDVELIAYEQELSDQVAGVSRGGGNDLSVGVGVGSWGNSGGVGIGFGKWLGGSDGPSPELLVRRDAVRSEMRRRGLLPPKEGDR